MANRRISFDLPFSSSLCQHIWQKTVGCFPYLSNPKGILLTGFANLPTFISQLWQLGKTSMENAAPLKINQDSSEVYYKSNDSELKRGVTIEATRSCEGSTDSVAAVEKGLEWLGQRKEKCETLMML